MILSSNTKKPQIHAGAYVAPSATISGDVTIDSGVAILHGAVVVSEGAPVTIGSETVIMENAVLRASGGAASQFPLSMGKRCIVGPHAYISGAQIAPGCFIAGAARVCNGARIGEGSSIGLHAIVYVNAGLPAHTTVPMHCIAAGDPAAIYTPDRAAELVDAAAFFETVFNLEQTADVAARAAETYAKFLRKTHAQDVVLDEHRSTKPTRRSGEEPPQTQATPVDKVVDVMMFELEEMEHRRQEAIKRQKGR